MNQTCELRYILVAQNLTWQMSGQAHTTTVVGSPCPPHELQLQSGVKDPPKVAVKPVHPRVDWGEEEGLIRVALTEGPRDESLRQAEQPLAIGAGEATKLQGDLHVGPQLHQERVALVHVLQLL